MQEPRPPVIVGGHGQRRTPELAARYADELNVPFAAADHCARLYGLADEACERIGRDPSSLRRSVALVLCCGADEAEVERRSRAIGREPPELRAHGAAGTPDEVIACLQSYAAAGASRAYLQVLDLTDLDHVAYVADHVMPFV